MLACVQNIISELITFFTDMSINNYCTLLRIFQIEGGFILFTLVESKVRISVS
jgi:hypothetical protein